MFKKKILITGYSGFVGQNILNFMGEKYDFEKLSLREPIKDFDNNLNYDAIIHLAGKAHDLRNVSAPDDYFTINRDATIKLFNNFLNSNIKDFFYFSSVKAVVDSIDGVLSEEQYPEPLTIYGKSKLEAELYLLSTNIPDNKRVFIIRPCMIHGPGNKGNLNLLYKIVKNNLPWPLGAYDNSRSFIYIENLIFLISKMIHSNELPSGVYNFADDEYLSTNELISTISATLNKSNKILKVPKLFVEIAAKFGNLIPIPINSERLNKLTESYRVSNYKIKKALKIEKLPFTAKEGIIKTIKSF